MTASILLQQLATKHSPYAIADAIGLHPNTVNRWLEQGSVPNHYIGDFKRMLGQSGEADDQFYTKPEIAKQCYAAFLRVAENLRIDLADYDFIEPSAGAGAFYQQLPMARRLGLDLAPGHGEIQQGDFLLWQPPLDKIAENPSAEACHASKNRPAKKYIVIGNPPFGLRGHLALQFINHAAEFADLVAFILPQLFMSDGKGVPKKRVDGRLLLAHSEALPSASFTTPDGRDLAISTIFQVWSKINHHRIATQPRKTCANFLRIYSLSDGGTPASTRNKHMIGKCHLYLPSTCFAGMRAYDAFHDLPNKRGYGIVIHKSRAAIRHILRKHNWQHTAFPSTNGALNLRRGLIEEVVIAKGFHE